MALLVVSCVRVFLSPAPAVWGTLTGLPTGRLASQPLVHRPVLRAPWFFQLLTICAVVDCGYRGQYPKRLAWSRAFTDPAWEKKKRWFT